MNQSTFICSIVNYIWIQLINL